MKEDNFEYQAKEVFSDMLDDYNKLLKLWIG